MTYFDINSSNDRLDIIPHFVARDKTNSIMFYYFYFALLFVATCNGKQQLGTVGAPGPSQICTRRNGFYKQGGSCDNYIECRDFVASRLSCPEGLHFNPKAQWPTYPCGYPMDVPCLNRGAVQPAKPTAECPHQYGFFPSLKASPDRCGSYRLCVEGQAIEMSCPVGLAFNAVTGRCDWPDLVPSCNADEFFGFKCPTAPVDADGKLLDVVLNYKYEGECYYFFSCDKGRARLLSCDYGFAFDSVLGKCVDAELVQCQEQRVPQLQAEPMAHIQVIE